MTTKDLEELIRSIMEELFERLEELKDVTKDGDQYLYGLKTAYIEWFEGLQEIWEKLTRIPFPFNIEHLFPL